MTILFLTPAVKIKVLLIDDENDWLFSFSDQPIKKSRVYLKDVYIIQDTGC